LTLLTSISTSISTSNCQRPIFEIEVEVEIEIKKNQLLTL